MKLFTVILVLCVALVAVEARNIQGGGQQVQTRMPIRRFFARNGLQQQRVFQRNGIFQGNRRHLRPRQRPLTQVVVKEPLAANAVAAQPEVTIQAVPKVEEVVAVAQTAVEKTEN